MNKTRSSGAFNEWWSRREDVRHRPIIVYDEIMAAWNGALDFANKLPKHERNSNLMTYKCWLNEDMEQQMEQFAHRVLDGEFK